MEWKECRIQEVCRLINGRAYSNDEMLEKGKYKIVRVGNLSGGNSTWFYSDLELPEDKYCHNGDLLFAWACTFGPHIWKEDNTIFHYHIWKIELNKDFLDKEFFYYYLKYATGGFLGALNGSVMVHITKSSMEKMNIRIPKNVDTQRRISSLLSSLDRKIELNNKLNAELEEMAQAIFKNWFVDFEPFKDGKFVESELGRIPEGWEVVSLDDLTSKFGTGLNPRKNFVLGHGSNFYVTIKNMGNNRIYLDNRCDKVDDEALVKINKRSKLQKGDLLFSGIGTIGRVAMIVDEPTNWNTSESVFNLHPIDTVSSEFLYLLLLSDVFQQYVKQNAQGGVQQGIRMASLKAFHLAIPSDLKEFTALVKPIIAKIKNNDKENDHLSHLRDTLLPRLMSGEIEIPE